MRFSGVEARWLPAAGEIRAPSERITARLSARGVM